MKIYPYNYPLILNDDTFVAYGGSTGTTTPQMRTAAYLIAEQQMSNHVGTFLLPTVITGSWDYQFGNGYLATEYGYVSGLLGFVVQDHLGNTLKQLTGTHHNFAAIHDDSFGYLYIDQFLGYCSIPCNNPYKFQAVYEAGLPTGVASQPGMLVALTAASQLVLNELLPVPANESTGDVGVLSFKSLDYSEVRKGWHKTAFGDSPKAAWVAHMVDSTIRKARRAILFGRGL